MLSIKTSIPQTWKLFFNSCPFFGFSCSCSWISFLNNETDTNLKLMKLKHISSILVLSGICSFTSAQISWNNNTLILENDKMINVLSFQNNRIRPESIFSKELNRDLLNENTEIPWFEFVIDHKLLKSTDPIWKYQTHSIRKLNNGGEEVRIILEATKIVKGLQLEIYRQYFPGSSMIRERIRLKTSSRSFELNKLDDRLQDRKSVV